MLSLEVPDNRKVADAWELCVSKVIKRRVEEVTNFALCYPSVEHFTLMYVGASN